MSSLGLPLEVCFRKGLDRWGKDKHYLRSLPEHTMSPMCLLVLSAWRYFSSRGEGTRAQAAEFLSSFLRLFFAGEDIELMLEVDSAADYRPCCVHSSASLALPVDDGRVFLKPLLAALPEKRAHRLHALMIAEEFVPCQQLGFIPLHECLLLVFVFKERWLLKQVFGQVSKFVDVLMAEKDFGSCPLRVDEDSPSLPKHARRDRHLVHKLDLGEGGGGEAASGHGSRGALCGRTSCSRLPPSA